jgi:excisionase family DNA binding protein
MHGSADMAGMSDGRSRRTFFCLEIACQDQPLEMKLESTPDVSHLEMRAVRGPFLSVRFGRIFSLAFLSSYSVAAFHALNSDSGNGMFFATWQEASEIIAPEASHSHATFRNICRDSPSEGDRCMKDTHHPIRHLPRHPRIFAKVRSRRSCACHDHQFGHGQNTGLGWSDPTFVHVSVPKVIRGVAPAQLRGDRAGVFCQRNISHQGATVMNNGEEKHIELLTVQETAKLLKVPVSWVYGHTRKRSIDPLPGYRLGKYWRFREDEVLAWVVRQRTGRQAA